ncbi:MAG: tRNA dihydrouridine synthase [Candidatus Hodarchaeota archaeon]
MKLGTLRLENRYILAPMQNVTTGPYRRFCRKFQKIGLVSVPMLYTKRIEKNPDTLVYDLYKIEEERPISVQLISSNPISLKKSIDYLESYSFDVLDINAGCPSRRAIKAKEGGYLLKNLESLENLINTAIKNSSKPVSLKIRIGFENSNNIKEIAEIANNSGIDFLTVHARTVKSFFERNTLNLEFVKKLKENLIIPLVGNGDISSPIAAKYFIDYTNVDALMIGRETMGNPQIFNQIHEYFIQGKEILFKNDKNVMKQNIELYKKCLDELLNGIILPRNINEYKFVELKRNSIWLAKGIKNSAIIRKQISNSKNLEHLELILNTI